MNDWQTTDIKEFPVATATAIVAGFLLLVIAVTGAATALGETANGLSRPDSGAVLQFP